jgi:hypothetical protein
VYGLPADFDASFLVGRMLSQIWFQEYSMQFLFGEALTEGPTISLQSTFLFLSASDGEVERGEVPVSDSRVMQLIGKHVRQAAGSIEGTLRLEFESGAAIEFLDDNEHYESYQIRAADRFIIV